MPVTVQLSGQCGNGNHLQFSVTGDAGDRAYEMNVADLSQPVTEDDVRTFLRVLIKISKLTRTWGAVRSLFTAGVTIG